MYISSRSWHARVYMWWFRMKHGEYASPRQMNLCPYVRAVLFWSWGRWLFRSGKLGRGKYAVRVPYVFWGLQPVWMLFATDVIFGRKAFMAVLMALGILLGIVSALSTLGLLFYLLIRFFKLRRVQHALDTGVEGAASFGRVIKERVVAGHHRICPIVEFREE